MRDMLSKQKLQDKIEKKKQETQEQKMRLLADIEILEKEAEGYIKALTEMLRYAPNEEGEDTTTLRAGSEVAKAKESLEKAGKPLHISDLIVAIGKENTKSNRISLSGSIGAYVRKGEIFTRPAPNTFGLINMPEKNTAPTKVEADVGDEVDASSNVNKANLHDLL